jgi:hypothetical protein
MDISTLTSNKWARISAVGVSALAVGVGVGYVIKKRRRKAEEIESDQLVMNFDFTDIEDFGEESTVFSEPPPPVIFDERLPDRIMEADAEPRVPIMYNNLSETMIEGKEEVVSEVQVIEEPPEDILEEDEDLQIESVFASGGDDWNYEEERVNRTDDAPYIIHQDEYIRDESGFEQSTLTYYAGDDILVDEADVPIYDQTIVGELRFGHGTNDKHVVYVRNPTLKAEYEILEHSGSYASEIQGLEAEVELANEMKHADRALRFRSSD